MAVRESKAQWEGSLREGKGTVVVGDEAFEGAYSYASRFEESEGTNPEELLGAAHAGCFSMALAGELARSGFEVGRIETNARVHLGNGPDGHRIERVDLEVVGYNMRHMEWREFDTYAKRAKENCPISKALRGVEITLSSRMA